MGLDLVAAGAARSADAAGAAHAAGSAHSHSAGSEHAARSAGSAPVIAALDSCRAADAAIDHESIVGTLLHVARHVGFAVVNRARSLTRGV